jgi:hypothetical protein
MYHLVMSFDLYEHWWVNYFGIFQMYHAENASLPAGKISWVLTTVRLPSSFFVGALASCLVYANTVRWIFNLVLVSSLLRYAGNTGSIS